MVTPQTLLHKYKCLWSVKGKSQGSSIQERILHTYTLRLGYNKNSILYQKTKTKTYYKECQPATKPRPKIHALIRLSYPSPIFGPSKSNTLQVTYMANQCSILSKEVLASSEDDGHSTNIFPQV